MNNIVILAAMAEQLKKPARATVNSEAAFVRERLFKLGFDKEANAYWLWFCSFKSPRPDWVTEEISSMQMQLNKIDKRQTMPEWGTYGT